MGTSRPMGIFSFLCFSWDEHSVNSCPTELMEYVCIPGHSNRQSTFNLTYPSGSQGYNRTTRNPCLSYLSP